MFMRFVQLRLNPKHIEAFRHFYELIVIEKLQQLDGCQYAGLIQNHPHLEEFISLTLWDTQAQAESYETCGIYQDLIEKQKPFFAESTEWKLQLSKDLKLEHVPVEEEPEIKQMSVSKHAGEQVSKTQPMGDLQVRIVSAKIEKNKLDEFKKIYETEIIPALLSTTGCRYAFLSENLKEANEFLSISIWDSKEDIERYEHSGQFSTLLEKVNHTFTDFVQWMTELEKTSAMSVSSSADTDVSRYKLVTAKSFRE